MSNWKYAVEYYGFLGLRNLLKVLNLCPIHKKTVLFYSFNGKQYSCNPRSISEYMHEKDPSIEIVWAFKDPDKFEGIVPSYVKRIKFRSPEYFYIAKTAKTLITNVQTYGELSRRKSQIFIQTWHASNGYKKVGTQYSGYRRKLDLLGHRDYSYVLCGCKNMETNRVRKSMQFKGPVIKGTPRIDYVLNSNQETIRQHVYEAIGLSNNKKILLYAPTWRDYNKDGFEYALDYKALTQALSKRFGGDWIIGVRLHPNVRQTLDLDPRYAINLTQYPDMEDLVVCADAMITDYSSCIWDFSFTGRPSFLYCSDLERYSDERAFDLPIKEWGFSISTSMEELLAKVEAFDETEYRESVRKHQSMMGSYEDGHSNERIWDMIQQELT